MKGTALVVARSFVQERFDDNKWQEILQRAGMKGKPILATREYPNELIGVFGKLIADELNVELDDWVRIFGRYFTSSFAPLYYKAYFRPGWKLKDFLPYIPRVYSVATAGFDPGARGGVLTEWVDDRTIRYTYQTSLGLVSFLTGLIEGAAEHYGEPVSVERTAEMVVEAELQ